MVTRAASMDQLEKVWPDDIINLNLVALTQLKPDC